MFLSQDDTCSALLKTGDNLFCFSVVLDAVVKLCWWNTGKWQDNEYYFIFGLIRKSRTRSIFTTDNQGVADILYLKYKAERWNLRIFLYCLLCAYSDLICYIAGMENFISVKNIWLKGRSVVDIIDHKWNIRLFGECYPSHMLSVHFMKLA